MIYSENKKDTVNISRETLLKMLAGNLTNIQKAECVKNTRELETIGIFLEELKEAHDDKTIIETLCLICSKIFVESDDYKNNEEVAEKIKDIGLIDYDEKNKAIRHGNSAYKCADISLKTEYTNVEDADYLHRLMILYISLWAADYERAIYVLSEMNKITEQLNDVSRFTQEFNILKSVFNFFCDNRGFVFCDNIWTEEELAAFQKFAAPLKRHSSKIAKKAEYIQRRSENIFSFAKEHEIEMTDNGEQNAQNYYEGKKKWLRELAKTKSAEELEQIEKEQWSKDDAPIDIWSLSNNVGEI